MCFFGKLLFREHKLRKIILALLTLIVFIYWDLLIRVRYLFRRDGIEVWVDRQFHRICSLLFSFTAFFVNVHIHFEKADNLELPDTFMLISNHQSIQDIPLLIWSFPEHDLRFSAKESLFKWIPMVSIMLRTQEHGKINRKGSPAETMKTLERVALKSRQGYCPVVFPEGTRSRDGRVGTFHHGAVRKMLSANAIPVVSAAIEGGWRVGNVEGLVKNMADFNYHVKILARYDAPESKKDIQNIISQAHSDITKQVELWQKSDRENPKTTKGFHVRPF
jgi:1-acyl-sn-glycerol-3-phosphate acyltransferase